LHRHAKNYPIFVVDVRQWGGADVLPLYVYV